MKVICSRRSLLVLVILLVAGCAATPMNPVAGMSVKELDRMAALSVLGGIKKYGQHPEVPETRCMRHLISKRSDSAAKRLKWEQDSITLKTAD